MVTGHICTPDGVQGVTYLLHHAFCYYGEWLQLLMYLVGEYIVSDESCVMCESG